jgi:beta-phosphoglucomutase
MNKVCFIFDLDGVIVDTAKFHFIAWQNLAKSLGIDFTEPENEQLKGVSRVHSLEKILEWGNKNVLEETFQELMDQKNREYLNYVNTMTPNDILPGVLPVLNFLKDNKYPIALGSASKNAKTILDKTNINHYFQAVVDGNAVTRAKPNPEVFLKAAELTHSLPENCIVFEDSLAGVQAANTAKMISIGIGDPAVLGSAQFVFTSFEEIKIPFIESLISSFGNSSQSIGMKKP